MINSTPHADHAVTTYKKIKFSLVIVQLFKQLIRYTVPVRTTYD